MRYYPQLSTGAVAQYPSARGRHLRTVVNTLPDGSQVKLSDGLGSRTYWRLEYSGLSDEERLTLEEFFSSCRGPLESFTFLDPFDNLLRWSGDLSKQAWRGDPLLETAPGTDGSVRLTNRGQVSQLVSQRLADVPASFTYCFSASVRSTERAEVTVSLGSNSVSAVAGSHWQQVWCTSSGVAQSVDASITVEAGASVLIREVLVQAQPMPGSYRQTWGECGVRTAVRFDQDRMEFTTIGLNDHLTTVRLTTTGE